MKRVSGLLLFAALPFLPSAPAASQQGPNITFTSQPAAARQTGALALAQGGRVLPICVADDDWRGVRRAAQSLAHDFQRVTGTSAELSCRAGEDGSAILIGTLGHSRIINALVQKHKLDPAAIRGKWESTITSVVDRPGFGLRRALVIAGSDKRGAIFGVYDLSKAMGVSPWYWWADVPVVHHDSVYVMPGSYLSPEPAVQYRGIFLNDEAPALTGWVKATYGGYNHEFYEHVFELLLRLHANYLWPAMWNSAFNEDDPLNPKLADEYGIVMGTSHHEPMLRSQQEWKRHGKGPWDYAKNGPELRDFWTEGIARNGNYESTITLGMRGDGDMPMSEKDDVALLEKIVSDQRDILKQHETPTLKTDPQVWALYKEVQGYYEKGMRVPEDVTLLWCDDNWGNIRRLPTPEERKRKGGAGIYYHFDYVGGPRSYKWLLTYPLPKVWEQMNLALHYDARRIWIVNVGDLKPMEMPIEFFLDQARRGTSFTQDDIAPWTRDWAARQFGPQHATEIADLLVKYTKYNGRRKPEQLEPDTWSLLDDNEADRVEREWKSLVEKAEQINAKLPEDARPAYFELVLYPIKASATVNEMYIEVGRNHLWAAQGRASANDAAAAAQRLFAEDARLSDEYNHKLLNGKWKHIMDQTHIGYTFWNEPPLNSMPAVNFVQPLDHASMGVAVEGTRFAITGAAPRPLALPPFDSLHQQTRTLTIFNSGTGSFRWTAHSDAAWLKLSATSGTTEGQSDVKVTIDWATAPAGQSDSAIHIQQTDLQQMNGPSATISVHVRKPEDMTLAQLNGFAEINGELSIEAEHTTSRKPSDHFRWATLPDYGETQSAVTIFPVNASPATDPAHSAALDYSAWFDDTGTFDADFILAPTLNFAPGRGLRFAVCVDDTAPQTIDALAHNSDQDWARAVSDGVRHVRFPLTVAQRGHHTLHVFAIDPGVVLEKIILRKHPESPRQRPTSESYLGPPESPHGESATHP